MSFVQVWTNPPENAFDLSRASTRRKNSLGLSFWWRDSLQALSVRVAASKIPHISKTNPERQRPFGFEPTTTRLPTERLMPVRERRMISPGGIKWLSAVD